MWTGRHASIERYGVSTPAGRNDKIDLFSANAAAPRASSWSPSRAAQILDVTGPAEVFAAANVQRRRPVYDLRIVSPDGGAVAIAMPAWRIHAGASAASPTRCSSSAASRRPAGRDARAARRRWLRRGAAGAPQRLGLLGRVRAGAGRPPRRQARRHPLVGLRSSSPTRFPALTSTRDASSSSTAGSGPRPA